MGRQSRKLSMASRKSRKRKHQSRNHRFYPTSYPQYLQQLAPFWQRYSCSSWQRKHTHTKKKEVEAKRRSWSIQTKDEEISSPSKLFHGAPFTYFPGTCINRFYSNLISKSRSHLKFAVTLSFYVVFLGLTSRNYLLSPKLNHGLSLRKYYIFENKLYMSAKYLYLEEYIL